MSQNAQQGRVTRNRTAAAEEGGDYNNREVAEGGKATSEGSRSVRSRSVVDDRSEAGGQDSDSDTPTASTRRTHLYSSTTARDQGGGTRAAQRRTEQSNVSDQDKGGSGAGRGTNNGSKRGSHVELDDRLAEINDKLERLIDSSARTLGVERRDMDLFLQTEQDF